MPRRAERRSRPSGHRTAEEAQPLARSFLVNCKDILPAIDRVYKLKGKEPMNALRRAFLSCTAPIHGSLRGKKVDIFMEMLDTDGGVSLLDVGGGAGLTGEFCRLYGAFQSVTVINVTMPPQLQDFTMATRPDIILGDGCCLPFRTKSYDWVFSNAVIEHVGGWERQKRFANEIRRVARKGYFITTPNKYFPIEPHTYLPLYQFLPDAAQRKVIRFAPAWVHDYASSKEIDLLTPRQFQNLFPEAEVKKTGIPLMPNSLVACYRANRPTGQYPTRQIPANRNGGVNDVA